MQEIIRDFVNQETYEKEIVLKIIDLDGGKNKEILREQFNNSKVIKREINYAGFFTHFNVPDSLPKCDKLNFDIGEITVYLNDDDENPVGFILFIREGKIDFLECYPYSAKYPENITKYKIVYR